MKKHEKFPEDKRNINTSPTDIKGKDVNEANQTNSGAGGGEVKEGSNPLPKNDKLDPYAKIVAEKSTTNIKAIANDFRIFLNSSLFM